MSRQEILDSVFCFKNKSTNEDIKIEKKELMFQRNKYSSTLENIWHVKINDVILKKTSNFIIGYNCLSCNKPNIVSTTQFLRKIRKCKYNCFQCQLEILNTKPNHNLCKNKNVKKYTLEELRKISKNEFELFSDEYKNSYFLKHLTEDDFERIKPKIISICNGKYTNMETIDFWSIFKTNNQMIFSSVLYDREKNIIFKPNQPIVICDNCENNWRAKSLESFKNCYKLLCPTCKFSNKVFKIRPMKNIHNEIILYQSKLEKKFIDWCNNKNILCKNGPTIKYLWNGKEKSYRVDFQIGETLIEIKDFHIWHKNQVKNGIWQEKINAVDELLKTKQYEKYLFITPQNWDDMLNKI